jgi:hypothetical protein
MAANNFDREERVVYLRDEYLPRNLSLLQTFNALVVAFNSSIPDNVRPFFDPGVQLTTLGPPTTYFGIDDVMNYLTGIMQREPHPFFDPGQTPTPGAGPATVSGQGLWSDSDTPHAHIRYIFTFVLSNGAWRVTNLWGTPA